MTRRTFDTVHSETVAAKDTLRELLEELAEYAKPELRIDLLVLADTMDEDVCRALNGFEP